MSVRFDACRKRFPDAKIVASEGAIPRLRQKGHTGLVATSDIALPAGMRWLIPEGTKNGEAWLSVDGETRPTWLVCDAFFHEPRRIEGVEGALLRWARTSPGLCLGATFKFLCLRDPRRFRAWVLEALARENPLRVLFSHGETLEGDVTTRLTELLQARLA